MRTAKPPSGRKVSDWVGLRVRNRVPIGRVQPGYIWEVVHARAGLTLSGFPCAHCGMRPFAARVDPNDVEVI